MAVCLIEVDFVHFPDEQWSNKDSRTADIDAEKLDQAVAYAAENESTIPKDFSNHEERFGERVGPLPDERGTPNGLILHEGEIIGEWGDTSAVDLAFSVTKSFISVCAGLAYDRNLIKDLDDRVSEYIDDGGFEDPHNQSITWRHLLQNTSEWKGTLFGKRDRQDRRGGINRELEQPGTFFEYNDVRVNRLSLSLLQLFERELPDILRTELMDPIGASDTWEWYGYENSYVDVAGDRLQSVSGGGHWGGGLHIDTYDLARFGLLALNSGTWDGSQILSEEWFRNSLEPCRVHHEYGFMWWLNTEQDLWERAPPTSFAALGYGSNIIWVDPTRDIVAVIRWFGDRSDQYEMMDELFHRIVTAVDSGA